MLPEGVLEGGGAGTRLVYKLIFPDTRGAVGEGGRGRWVERVLGSVVVGGGGDNNNGEGGDDDMDDDAPMSNGADISTEKLTGDADKTLADARFVIGDYVACTILPPLADGRVAPLPAMNRGGRDAYVPPRGPPPGRENGYGPPRGGRGGGGYDNGYGGPRGSNGFASTSDWRRGERPPGAPAGGGGGYGRGGGGGGGGYRGGRGRMY